eukprot:4960746-Pyramimonas_sp.AAC.1
MLRGASSERARRPLGGSSGASWERLWALLERPLEGLLGPPGSFSRLRARSGRSGSHVGTLSESFWGPLGPSGRPLGLSWGPHESF